MNVFVQTLLKMHAYLWFALNYVALLPRKNASQTFFSVEKINIKQANFADKADFKTVFLFSYCHRS